MQHPYLTKVHLWTWCFSRLWSEIPCLQHRSDKRRERRGTKEQAGSVDGDRRMQTDPRRAGGHNACNAENNLRGGEILRVVDRQGQTHWAINHYEGVLIRDPNRGQVGCQLGTPPTRKAAIQARRGNWRRARFNLCKPATNSEASAIDRLLARARAALALRGRDRS